MLVAIEGIDGSGKATQVRLLTERCDAEELSWFKVAFPQYGRTPFAEAIAEYLNGAFGGVNEVHPKLVSVLYAADRYAIRDQLLGAMQTKDLIVCDRYVASNMAHQAAKLPLSDRDSFVIWLERVEYEAFALPRADLTIFLDVPVRTSHALVHRKADRSATSETAEGEQGGYTSLRADIHEADLDYLESCRQVYQHLASENVGGPWAQVACTNSAGEMRHEGEIAAEVWNLVQADLRAKTSRDGAVS